MQQPIDAVAPGVWVKHPNTERVGTVLKITDGMAWVEFNHGGGICTYGDFPVESLAVLNVEAIVKQVVVSTVIDAANDMAEKMIEHVIADNSDLGKITL